MQVRQWMCRLPSRTGLVINFEGRKDSLQLGIPTQISGETYFTPAVAIGETKPYPNDYQAGSYQACLPPSWRSRPNDNRIAHFSVSSLSSAAFQFRSFVSQADIDPYLLKFRKDSAFYVYSNIYSATPKISLISFADRSQSFKGRFLCLSYSSSIGQYCAFIRSRSL